jgi:hypothetical protein
MAVCAPESSSRSKEKVSPFVLEDTFETAAWRLPNLAFRCPTSTASSRYCTSNQLLDPFGENNEVQSKGFVHTYSVGSSTTPLVDVDAELQPGEDVRNAKAERHVVNLSLDFRRAIRKIDCIAVE